MWRYASERVREKVHERDIRDEQVGSVLASPGEILAGGHGRRVVQGVRMRPDFGEMLLRVVCEVVGDEEVVVSAYWTRPERYARGL